MKTNLRTKYIAEVGLQTTTKPFEGIPTQHFYASGDLKDRA